MSRRVGGNHLEQAAGHQVTDVLVQHHYRFRAVKAGGVEGTVDRGIDHFTHDLLLKLAGIVAQCRVFGHL
jgi:hypothetical protein